MAVKKFALIGASGYVAPRHMKAIKSVGGNLIAALDPFDSVGIIDNYFPSAGFFVEFERFDRHLEKLRRTGVQLDYLSVCSPNYLHDAHCRFGLRLGADVICEKPMVLNPWNIDALQEMENETGGKIFNMLQLRLHPSIAQLKQRIEQEPSEVVHEIDLTYITSRGKWYYTSWKGDVQKSGGIATNIGIHFFDMLIWIFGDVKENIIYTRSHDRASGFLALEKARVKWFLSVNEETLPQAAKTKGHRTFRRLRIGEEAFDFSTGFENLHTEVYQRVLSGDGFRIGETRKSISLVHDIRHAKEQLIDERAHELAALSKRSHPFLRKGK